MKKLLLISAALCLLATSAFASGVDLVVTACPGNAGSSNDAGSLDCAGGATLILLGVFQPAEAITDLVAADAILDFTVTGGDLNAPSAAFWDLQTNNSAALNGASGRPATLCVGYNNAFGVANSGFAAAAAVQASNRVRVATTSYRPSNLNAALNQKIFGFQLLLDLSTSAEASGAGGNGCMLPIAFALEQIVPGSAANNPVTTLTSGATNPSPSATSQVVLANTSGQPVPAARHSWGQLKSLYR